MTFLAPALLAGASAVSLPIILHFFYKARHRPLPWAAMQFLRKSIESTSKRLKFQEWILLLLRCLALLLLAMAFARPSCSPLATGSLESVDAIFLLDTSYSMGAREGETSRFELAKKAALNVIDSLPANSTVQVIGVSDRATPLGPLSPRNLEEARRVLRDCTLTSLAGDVLAGVAEAIPALDQNQGTRKEVYFFTDLQKTGWERQAGAIRGRIQELSERASLTLVRCGSERPIKNVALVDLDFPGMVVHADPQRPTRLPVTVTLRNSSPEPVRNLSLTLETEGPTAEKETRVLEEIAPGETLPVTLTARFERAGVIRVTATLTGDELPGDDRLDRLIPVRDQVRVLVVDGSPSPRDPKYSASHFVVNALTPVAQSRRADYFVQVEVITPEQARPTSLSGVDLCVLCNVALGTNGLNKDFVDRLVPFVTSGGGLLIGSGTNVRADAYNAQLGATGANLLPQELAAVIRGTAERPLHPAPETVESPGFLSRFREEPFRTVTSDVELQEVLALREGSTASSRVILKLTDGTPLIAARTVGLGEVVWIGTSLDSSQGNWPSRAGSYLSLMQYTLAHFANRGSRGGNFVAGTPIVLRPNEASRPFEVYRPDGSVVRLGKAVSENDQLTVRVVATELAGVYRVGMEESAVNQWSRYAAMADLRESDDLRSASASELETILGFKPLLLSCDSDLQNSSVADRSQRELTIWLLIALFILACVETGWAWLCGRSW